MLLFWLLKT